MLVMDTGMPLDIESLSRPHICDWCELAWTVPGPEPSRDLLPPRRVNSEG